MNKRLKLAKSKTISYIKLPFDFFENHFQSFPSQVVKVYLYILYLCTLGDIEFDDNTIADRLNITIKDLKNAYKLLNRAGMLVENEDGEEELVNPVDFYREYHKEVKDEIKKDSDERLRTVSEDRGYQKKVEFIEERYGKELTRSDYLEIFDMLENMKIPYDVLLAAVDYSISKNVRSFSYIAKVALNWKELGLTTYESCEQFINGGDDVLKTVKKLLKIDRKLYDVEIKYITDWCKMGKTVADIENAIKASVLNTGKASFPYINAVLCDSGNGKKEKTAVKSQKKPNVHNFPERDDYDFERMISDLRKKQND